METENETIVTPFRHYVNSTKMIGVRFSPFDTRLQFQSTLLDEYDPVQLNHDEGVLVSHEYMACISDCE